MVRWRSASTHFATGSAFAGAVLLTLPGAVAGSTPARCGVRKIGSCGEAVFVNEAAEAVAALDAA